jgi:hypothetical protein
MPNRFAWGETAGSGKFHLGMATCDYDAHPDGVRPCRTRFEAFVGQTRGIDMKMRCTILCMVVAAVAFTLRRSEAQSYYGPYQPGYGAATEPGWPGAGQQSPVVPGPQYASYANMGGLPPGAYGPGPGPGAYPPAAGQPADYCQDCGDCGCSGERLWVDAEFLVWWREGRSLPPLATTSPPGTTRPLAGVLPNAQILFGGERVGKDEALGVRLEMGVWLDKCDIWGVGVSAFGLGSGAVGFSQYSPGDPALAIPFYNTLTAAEDAQLVAFIDPVDGPLTRGQIVQATENHIYGGDFYLRKKINGAVLSDYMLFLMQGPAWVASCFEPLTGSFSSDVYGQASSSMGQRRFSRVDLIGGYQYSQIKDTLNSSFELVSLDPSFLNPVGTRIGVTDSYRADNVFHGGTIGMMATAEKGCWKLECLGKVGLGNMHQNVTVRGRTVVTLPPPFGFLSNTRNRGMFAQPSQTGSFSRDVFAVIPEAKIKLSRQFGCHWDGYMAYSFMYWNDVAMSGDQLNRNINPFEPDNTPNNLQIRGTSFWAQGVSFGAKFHY